MKWQTCFGVLALLVSIGEGCHKSPGALIEKEGIEVQRDALRAFEESWLHAAHVAPPTIEFSPRTQKRNGIQVTIEPILPEEQSWNQWNGPGYRLFNNRAAHLFKVTVHGQGTLKWIPEKTILRLNWPDQTLAPATRPDELLFPLREMALAEQKWGLTPDFTKRYRSVGPFRAQYLPVDPRPNKLSGVLAFPLLFDPGQVVALQVDLVIESGAGEIPFSWIYD